jgi:hypothetical protein
MQAGQCDSQMDTKFWEVVCNEHGIGGDGEDFDDNNAQFDTIFVLRSPRVCSKARRDRRWNPKSLRGELFRPGYLAKNIAGTGKN